MANYVELSEKISKYFNYNKGVFDKKDDILMSLLLARKRIIHKAANKLDAFKKIIKERYEKNGNLKYSLIYVPEGNKPDYIIDSDIFDKSEQVADDDVSNHLIDVYTEAGAMGRAAVPSMWATPWNPRTFLQNLKTASSAFPCRRLPSRRNQGKS